MLSIESLLWPSSQPSIVVYNYPWGGVTFLGQQQGIAYSVPADGSALYTVILPQTYATGITNVQATLQEITNIGLYALTLQISNVTASSFRIYVGGGAAGSYVNVFWQVFGS